MVMEMTGMAEQDDPMTTFATAVQQFVEVARPALQRMLESYLTFGQQLYESVQATYREAGAIYGDNDAGMQRWAREVSEARRLRMEADRIEADHAFLRDFKAKLAAQRAAQEGGQ